MMDDMIVFLSSKFDDKKLLYRVGMVAPYQRGDQVILRPMCRCYEHVASTTSAVNAGIMAMLSVLRTTSNFILFVVDHPGIPVAIGQHASHYDSLRRTLEAAAGGRFLVTHHAGYFTPDTVGVSAANIERYISIAQAVARECDVTSSPEKL